MEKIKHRLAQTLIIILTALLLVGCWDYRDINETTLIVSIGIDLVDDEYEMTGEYTILDQHGGSGSGEKSGGGGDMQSKVALIKGKGKDFEAARTEVNMQIKKPIFLGATAIAILGTKYAESGIESYMNRIDRLPDYRKTILVVISRETPRELFELGTERCFSVGTYIEENIAYLENKKAGIYYNVGHVLSDIAMGDIGYLLPYVGIEQEEISVIGMAAMSDSKLVGTLDLEETSSAVYLRVRKAKLTEVIPYADTLFSLNTELKRRNVTFDYKNNQLCININLNIRASMDHQYNMTYLDEEDFKNMENLLSYQIRDKIVSLLKRSQDEFKSDIIGYARYFRGKEYDLYNIFDWKELYLSAKFNVTVDTRITDWHLMDTEAKKVR